MQTLFSKFKNSKSLLSGAGFLMLSTIFVNAGNYAINLILGRYLGPAAFAEANLLATMVMTLSFIAVGLQLCVAKYGAIYFAQNDINKLEDLKAHFVNTGKRLSLFALPILMLLTPFIQSYLRFESIVPIVILFLGIPMYLLMSVSRGIFQGTNQFEKLAKSYLVEMLVRLIVTLGLVLALAHLDLSIHLVAIGFLSSFIATYLFCRIRVQQKTNNQLPLKEILQFLVIIGVYELSQILINNSDVILVKHFFGAQEAGLYAAIALIGRVVFFATWTVVTLLFPLVIEKEKRGEKHTHLFWGALTLVAIIGLSITAFCHYYSEEIISIIYGTAYLSSAHLLSMYSLATCCFACANVFAYYHMSLNNYIPVFLSIAIGLLQILSIYILHDSLVTIIWIQIFLMSLLLISMMVYHSFKTIQSSQTLAY